MDLEQNVSWSEIESIVQILAKKISNSSRTYSSIVTLSRGGLVPSRLLADHLDIKKILVDKPHISSNSLFVDDIFDTGDTFAKILYRVDNPSKLTFVTLFARRGKIFPKQLVYAKKPQVKEVMSFFLGIDLNFKDLKNNVFNSYIQGICPHGVSYNL